MASPNSSPKSALPETSSQEDGNRPLSVFSSISTDGPDATHVRINEQDCRITIDLSSSHVDILEAVAALLHAYNHTDYYAYECGEQWHIGLGSEATLLVDAEGSTMTTITRYGQKVKDVNIPLARIAREFVSKTIKHGGSKVYGYVGSNYSSHVRNQHYKPGQWPLISLMAPKSEVIFKDERIIVTGQKYETVIGICDILIDVVSSFDLSKTINIYTTVNSIAYKARVEQALAEIEDRNYLKVIASRAVDLQERVDMPATLLNGRRQNTPARTFCLKHEGFKATGFSPELVLSLEDGKVTTEPLAGTRSRVGTAEEVAERKRDLLGDTREVMEHVISVQAAIEELKTICEDKTVCIEDLMAVKERGSVMHLGSTVTGSILDGKDGWDALDVLFPAITASGIPKAPVLEAIQRLEPRPRELYSGAVLLIEGTKFFEATLVLRTVFQDENRAWVQAGAGIIAQSTPERELTETMEKLASVAPFVVAESPSI